VRPHLAAQVAKVARRLHANGWVANHDGNVSVRVGKDRFLCTPTAVSKADVDESMLIVVDGGGKVVEGTRKPFGELELHLAIYRARPDAHAVLHAHPPTASAFGVAGVSLEVAAMPEVLVSLGVGVPTLPLMLPKTPELVQGVEAMARRAHAFIAAGNGAWTLGVDLEQALLRMELVEHFAKIVFTARQLGGVKELAPEQVSKLLEARAKAGLEPPGAKDPTKAIVPPPKPEAKPVVAARKPARAFPPKPAGSPPPPDMDAIAERVAARLGGAALGEGELRRLVAEELERAIRGGAA
jgi:L-fuculose-phosphate aldolase